MLHSANVSLAFVHDQGIGHRRDIGVHVIPFGFTMLSPSAIGAAGPFGSILAITPASFRNIVAFL